MSQILIVESDRLLAKNLAAALRSAGHQAIFTADAQAAVNAADTKTPGVIIMDLLLAGRSGVELLYEIRSYPDWQNIPVIIYSNIEPNEVLSDCDTRELGISNFFYKPATKVKDLIEVVGHLTATISV